MKRKRMKFYNLLFLALVMLLLSQGNKQEVSAAAKCKVVFANAKGIVSNDIFRSYAKIVESGSTIQLPKYKKDGYRSYWVCKNGGSSRKYVPGTTIRVTQNMKFCLQNQKLYNIRFFTSNGQREYTELSVQLCKGQYFVLPSVPSSDSLNGLGWSYSKGISSYKKSGTKVKVTGDMNLYGVFRRVYTVELRRQSGGSYKCYTLDVDQTYKFPAVDTKDGNMFLGWSTQQGKSSQPEYYAGDVVPKKSATYYMVVFDKSMDNVPKTIENPETYDKVYFVGDSRTYHMRKYVSEYRTDKVAFLSKPGMGLTWLKNVAYSTLLNAVRKQPLHKKKAVVINLGINDLPNVNGYVSYMKSMAQSLKKYNCDMYFMSVNPANSAILKNRNGKIRTETEVKEFNATLYKHLCIGNNKTYGYINTHGYLRKFGWISFNNYGICDGVHYSKNTTLRIYNYAINHLNK